MDFRLMGAFLIAPIFSIAGFASFSVLKDFAPYNYIIAACLFIGAIWYCIDSVLLERGVTSSALYRSMFLTVTIIDVVCFSIVLFTRMASMP